MIFFDPRDQENRVRVALLTQIVGRLVICLSSEISGDPELIKACERLAALNKGEISPRELAEKMIDEDPEASAKRATARAWWGAMKEGKPVPPPAPDPAPGVVELVEKFRWSFRLTDPLDFEEGGG